jgi:hypothetical protein
MGEIKNIYILKDGHIELTLFKVFGYDCKSNERSGVVTDK